MMAIAFVDETYRDTRPGVPGYYQLTAAVLDRAEVAACRAGVIAIAPAGFHAAPMAAAKDYATVQAMLQYAANATGWNFIAMGVTAAKKMEALRQQCVEGLLLELGHQKVEHVVLDSREAIHGDPQARNKVDLATFRRLRAAGLLDSSMSIAHQHDTAEPMLSLPDAVGWAHRRHHLVGDSQYWPTVASVTSLITVP